MKKKNIVTIGGGTGSFVLLSGLKKYSVNISAIVSMADDGGSTGVLRDELGVLPPGDVRQCLVALSDSSDKLRELMNYRFEEGGLKGHSFGNLLLSALEKIEGGFSKGVAEATKILNVKGEVIPVTDQDTDLYMQLNNGKILAGQAEINHNYLIEKTGIRKNYLKPRAKANRRALSAIRNADLIVIGPGNHYCSIVPNFLVEGIPEAIMNSKAVVVYNCNLVNKKGHTEKFTLDDYVDSINGYIGSERIDYVTFNAKKPDARLIKKYAQKRELLVDYRQATRNNRDYEVINGNLISSQQPVFSPADVLADDRSLIRHDSRKLAKIIMIVLKKGKARQIMKKKNDRK